MANKTIIKGNIPNALHDVSPNHTVATADEIFDEDLQMYQSEINRSSGAYDISVKYPTSGVEGGNTYTLAGALAVLNANLSASMKKGGMSIKFIQSTDNKYVQFRLMSPTWSTDTANWQGVDDEPTAGSDNLVKSGGVAELNDKTQLSLCSIENSCEKNDIIVLEPGGINLTTGQLHEYDYARRVRTKNYFKAPLIYELNEGYEILGVVRYQLVDGEYSHVTTLLGSVFDIEYGDGYYYKFSVKHTDNSNISVTDNIFKTLLCGIQAISIENDGAYDVTAMSGGTTFDSLDGLLGSESLGTLIPVAKRRGGMSIKFVLTESNTYVQCRYMLPYNNTTAGNNAFKNVGNWQGVDDEPTAGSENLVKSGGVAELNDKTQLSLCSIENSCEKNDIIVLEPGGINLTTGQLQEYDNARRVRTKNYFKAPLIYELNEGYEILGVVRYQLVDGEYSRVNTLLIPTFDIEYGDGYYYKFSVKRTDNSNISVTDNIFKTLLCGIQAISIENRTRSITNEFNIAAHQQEITNLDVKITNLDVRVTQITDNFENLILQGYTPNSYTLSKLQTLETGNVGLPIDTRISTSTAFYTIRPQYKNIGNYVLSAMVVTGLEDVSVVGDDWTIYTLALSANYGNNANYTNIITQGRRVLDDSTVLVYNVSGRIESKNNEFASTIYARLTKDVELTFGISKMLVLEIDEWNEDYIDILIGNSLNNSTWIDNDKLELLKKDKIVLGRDLFSGIAFWGSSSTENKWVKDVANTLNMPYYWGGSGGENIWGIMGRMGILPLRIETPITIPASASEFVEFPNNYTFKVRWNGAYKSAKIWASKTVPSYKLLVNPCYIAGVKGNLIGGGANSDIPLQFQRLEDGVAVTTRPYEPIYTLGFRETRDCVWFLACHFNGGESSTEELVELYKKMYDVSCSKKVLILGRHKVANGVVTSPTLEMLQEQEVALEDEFGLMFFNTREYMCGRGFERFKELYPTDYTTTDIEQASQGITPDCMYTSAGSVHFNSKGYVVLTEAVTQRLIELGYNLDTKAAYTGDGNPDSNRLEAITQAEFDAIFNDW